ncbi:SAF domain-containing protein [uncultured Microbacterium sp.]|jgi:hypothetical protein|uniref:SAF domain-containing protein n=1 Tax=uncultured Microbacterium sp. TaxID=191216 RepID=UPI002638A3C4|nr:SAF domain-containing protein [uncultured Microbacterium sp.]
MMSSRARRPFFGDLRFLIGLILVIVSIAGVWLLVSSSRRTTPVLQASHTLVPGESVDSGDFQVVEVGLSALTDAYLAPQDLHKGAVATRTLPKGELVARSGVGDEKDSRVTTVVVSSTAIPAGVRAGSPVELWHAPLLKDGRTPDTPRILVGDAVVSSVSEAEGMLSQSRTDVEVVIDRADVGDVLAAITGGSTISIIPAGAGS